MSERFSCPVFLWKGLSKVSESMAGLQNAVNAQPKVRPLASPIFVASFKDKVLTL